jgi:hypothetical protein
LYPVDPVKKTLVVMGDLQVPYANISSSRTTNIPQLRQNDADIAAQIELIHGDL